MKGRRNFLIVAASLTTVGFFSTSTIALDEDDPLPPLPTNLHSLEGEADYFSAILDFESLGTATPPASQIAEAREIMAGAPSNCRPIDVAYYYRNIGLGLFKESWRPYARAWPRLYNPIIVEMFKTTGLDVLAPGGLGDATPWCAAFLNYCIARSRSKNGGIGPGERGFGSQSASSGSFRCWGTKTDTPREGDIVVWAEDGSIDGCKFGRGHVGFFARTTSNAEKPLLILGGNQSGSDTVPGTMRSGIIQKAMPLQYPVGSGPLQKRFFAFRTAEYLR